MLIEMYFHIIPLPVYLYLYLVHLYHTLYRPEPNRALQPSNLNGDVIRCDTISCLKKASETEVYMR